jgi:hypothetical protein
MRFKHGHMAMHTPYHFTPLLSTAEVPRRVSTVSPAFSVPHACKLPYRYQSVDTSAQVSSMSTRELWLLSMSCTTMPVQHGTYINIETLFNDGAEGCDLSCEERPDFINHIS